MCGILDPGSNFTGKAERAIRLVLAIDPQHRKGVAQMLQERSDVEPLAIQTVQDAVVERLRHLILSRQLQPGQKLVQAELAELLGVSRTPIRDALTRLAHEGLVVLSSYRSASVAEFSSSDLEEIFCVRVALERHATYLAVPHLTGEDLDQLEALLQEMADAFRCEDSERLWAAHHQFHVTIYAAAHSARLHALVLRYLELANVYQLMALSLGRGARDPVIEHREILDTVRQGDGEVAAELMRQHLELTTRELSELFHKEEVTCP
jgi:DNA-binding GntR family transcriptional regulator